MAKKSVPTRGGPSVVRIGLCQHASPPSVKPERNVARALDMIRDAAGRGATIISTQELFASHYFPQVEDPGHFALAEPIPGPTTTKIAALAKKLKVTILASIFEKRAPGIFHNTSVMIAPSGVVGKYRKMHIPDDPRFYEKYYFTPGDLGWSVQQTPAVRTGMLVCWDQWYPEAARLTAMRGAQILFYPTAIAWHREERVQVNREQHDAWVTIQRSHAIANGLFVAACNRVGVERDLTFWGSSFVCDPAGTVIAQASHDKEEVLIADCDLSRIDAIRQGWPFFRDRRIDAYQDLTRRYVDS